jgi:hypothetical protein
MTKSNVRDRPSAKVTSTPSGRSSKEAMESLKRNVTSLRRDRGDCRPEVSAYHAYAERRPTAGEHPVPGKDEAPVVLRA